ncbi:hypothetical protein J2X06_001776 [Lysobacter niastensis]|uniref:Nuclear transport factor 2 family protein n=1 Tax=Lysobacter niastensis TaxID=380629 RepID=A0ABU1WAE4_9GAMM|nr:nuclear transport factor 2 family protein [Lysobacter niastensis]MDR7134592.1 hypothetical protein [Lysobacter niastensis]
MLKPSRPGLQMPAWLAPALLALALLGCSRTAPEERLRAAMSELQASIEQRDAKELESYLAQDFVGPDGLDREGARRMAQVLFLRHRDVGVRTGPEEVTLQAGYATVRFSAALTGGAGGVLPDSAQVYDVESGWREEEGTWRLTSVRWTPKFQPAR